MINILITGANGQLGKSIFAKTKETTIDNINWDFKNSRDLDITDDNKLREVFKEKKYDYIINCAAYTNVEQAEKTPQLALAVNSNAIKYLTEICKEKSIKLIHISTDYVFDGEKSEPYKINDKTNPINEYGKSKLLGEQYIQKYLEKFFIIRTSWLYSKRYGKNFYRTILKKAQTEDKLTITSKEVGCPTDADDLATYIIALIIHKRDNYGIHHFCGDKIMSWYEFALDIIKSNKIENIEVFDQEYKTLAKRPRYSVLEKNN
ncbi:dTDP-4-dehydrorhamnose reductase [Aquimarina rhabdastrellae]